MAATRKAQQIATKRTLIEKLRELVDDFCDIRILPFTCGRHCSTALSLRRLQKSIEESIVQKRRQRQTSCHSSASADKLSEEPFFSRVSSQGCDSFGAYQIRSMTAPPSPENRAILTKLHAPPLYSL